MTERAPWRDVTTHTTEPGHVGTRLVLTLDCGHVVRQKGCRKIPRRVRCAPCYQRAEQEVDRIRKRIETALDAGRDFDL